MADTVKHVVVGVHLRLIPTALQDVLEERHAQLTQWGEQAHPNGTGQPGDRRRADQARTACDVAHATGSGTWRHILAEEYAEALAESDPAALRRELIQIAAVCVAWAQDIDRKGASA